MFIPDLFTASQRKRETNAPSIFRVRARKTNSKKIWGSQQFFICWSPLKRAEVVLKFAKGVLGCGKSSPPSHLKILPCHLCQLLALLLRS